MDDLKYDEYKRLLDNTIKEKTDLMQQRSALLKEAEEIERHLLGLEQAIEGYRFILRESDTELLVGSDPETVGFTDAIRNLFKSSKAHFPTEIRDALAKAGYERSSAKTLLIHVHNTLSRLVDQDELVPIEIDGKTAYRKKAVGLLGLNDIYAGTAGKLRKTE